MISFSCSYCPLPDIQISLPFQTVVAFIAGHCLLMIWKQMETLLTQHTHNPSYHSGANIDTGPSFQSAG